MAAKQFKGVIGVNIRKSTPDREPYGQRQSAGWRAHAD